VSGNQREKPKMKVLYYGALAAVVAIAGFTQAQSARNQVEGHDSARENLIGAWHLVGIEAPGPDGKPMPIPQPQGMLAYTSDGHMSVQLMYPKSAPGLSNDYVKNGYEASFGSYDVNEQAHTVTHHVEGSITEELVGKDLPRVYQFSDGHLIIKSARPAEHWSVTWEHY
jgi:hypothetical protein